jgi:8-oxo-dGTP pyrophosphatase MutT (NUDIX family)
MAANYIRVIAICVFRHGDKILVFEAFDSVDGRPFYRPLGGGVEFGETTQAALEREIKEELGEDITNIKLLTVLENLFMHEGKTGHEIVYVYDGRFKDTSIYGRDSLTVTEDNGEVLKATWRSLDSFNEYHRLVPEALTSLLKNKK